jgi:uncharacterized protein
MKPVFIDTSYYVALLSEGDAWHRVAVEWSERILGRQVVTEYVLVELGGAFSKARNRQAYVPFVRHLLADPSTLFIPASSDLFQRGLALFAARPDKDWSLVDCISFVVMKQHRLTDALTTDDHFKQAGFKRLLT